MLALDMHNETGYRLHISVPWEPAWDEIREEAREDGRNGDAQALRILTIPAEARRHASRLAARLRLSKPQEQVA